MRDLVLELSIQLERVLSQLCDEQACVTPEHAEVRELIERAKQALKNVSYPMTIYLNEPRPSRPLPPPGARGT